MHSKIFQIGLKPIVDEEKLTPESLYDNSSDFADYIGDEITGDYRTECIEMLASIFDDILEYKDGHLVYKGIGTFLLEWSDQIHTVADGLTANNLMQNLYTLSSLTERTHKDSYSRFYIDDWNGYAAPASDLIRFLIRLENGTKLYVGAVIDFHF